MEKGQYILTQLAVPKGQSFFSVAQVMHSNSRTTYETYFFSLDSESNVPSMNRCVETSISLYSQVEAFYISCLRSHSLHVISCINIIFPVTHLFINVVNEEIHISIYYISVRAVNLTALLIDK